MWTAEARCSTCEFKDECVDRKTIIPDLVNLSNTLNTVQANIDSPGDGILVMVCNDFRPKL